MNRHRRIIGRETKIRLSALLRVFVSESCIHELRIFTDFNRLRTSRTLGMPSPAITALGCLTLRLRVISNMLQNWRFLASIPRCLWKNDI